MRIKWLHQGDSNSRFFHSYVKQTRMHMHVHRIKSLQGEWLEDTQDVRQEAIKYFQSAFASEQERPSSSMLLRLIPKVLTDIDNDHLQEVPGAEEVQQVVFKMDGDAAPSLDGFTGRFFMAAWEVVGPDVVEAVHDFFAGVELP